MRSKLAGARTFTEEARRQQIVSCAVELIAESGYPQASIAKIAERADIAKSVVLYHFHSKDELVAAIVETVFAASAAVMVPRIAATSSATERLTAYIDANGEFLDTHRREAIALYEVSTSYRGGDGRRFDQAVQASVDASGVPPEFALLDPLTILSDGIRDGEFRTATDPHLLKNILRAALDGAVGELSRDDTYDVLAHTAAVKDLFLAAIGAHQ
ncbi:TetR/AcrR family transcriptional regulator [Aldersonia kunmingensis]|uniref:TetR/AcrR family transcriptional regulator n=1 Tax=Aldersonia kunmingensis TaxID=408066 RepID=UPI00082FA7CD|nr:TetR/AcrR family transcriptional regulator [Aldersonia kunmingensis]